MSWARLVLAADRLDDAEANREAATERLRSWLRKRDGDPPKGIAARKLAELVASNGSPPEAKSLAQEVALHLEIERITTLELRHAMRTHPLAGWVGEIKGIGEKAVGRLLGAIGDPAQRVDSNGEIHDSLSSLRSYCGFGDAQAQRRRKGQKVNWNPRARTAVWNIANAAFRQGHYRDAYLDARSAWADRDTTDLHKHNHALRIVAKSFLKDLYNEARRVQLTNDTQSAVDAVGNLGAGQSPFEDHFTHARADFVSTTEGVK